MSIGLSLVGVKSVEELTRIAEDFPDCTFELSYYSTHEFLKEAMPVIQGRIVSIHALTPKREFFPNLGFEGAFQWSRKEIIEDSRYAFSMGAVNIVLHPGYAIEALVHTDTAKRMEQVQNCGLEQYSLPGFPRICSPEYLKSGRYKKSFEIMTENAISVSELIFQDFGVRLCLENLPPRPGYLLFTPDEMIELANRGLSLCLDIGHMQVCSAVFGFDLTRAVCRVMESGAVRTMHMHSNPSCSGRYTDSHEGPGLYNKDLGRIVSCAKAHDVNMISEVVDNAYDSVRVLSAYSSLT